MNAILAISLIIGAWVMALIILKYLLLEPSKPQTQKQPKYSISNDILKANIRKVAEKKSDFNIDTINHILDSNNEIDHSKGNYHYVTTP